MKTSLARLFLCALFLGLAAAATPASADCWAYMADNTTCSIETVTSTGPNGWDVGAGGGPCTKPACWICTTIPIADGGNGYEECLTKPGASGGCLCRDGYIYGDFGKIWNCDNTSWGLCTYN